MAVDVRTAMPIRYGLHEEPAFVAPMRDAHSVAI
jgi:hypothetical protein